MRSNKQTKTSRNRQTKTYSSLLGRFTKLYKSGYQKYLLASLCLVAVACVLTYTTTGYALVTNYSFAASSGTFTQLSGATTVPLSGGTLDEGMYNSVPIGFNFYYDGQPYTTVSATTNGWMTFNQPLSFSNPGNALATSTIRPIIAPLWDDLEMDASGSFSYLTEGAAGNRIFTAQWLNVQWSWFVNSPVISFQVKLYEATGQVQFVYRQELTATNFGGASIGLTSLGTGSGNFLSLNDTSASPTFSSTVEQTNIAAKPATGQVYTFTPPSATPAAPTSLSFSAVALKSINVNWVDSSTTESMFIVYQSTDGTNFTEAGRVNSTSVAATGTPYALNVTGLSSATNYTFRVVAATEGVPPSPALEGTQATLTGTVSGLKVVGSAPSDYTTITAAFTDIQTNGLGGPVILELKSGYSSTTPLSLGYLGTSATNTITVRPATGATSCLLSSFSTLPAVDFSGSRFVIFDGRPGGVGTSKQLTIENNQSNGMAVRFINEGSNNTVMYSIVRGSNTSQTSGVVVFSTTTGTQGNDNNTVSYCDLRDGSTTPVNIIYASGTSTTTNQQNSGNVISNNNIFNFFSVISSFAAIRVSTGNTDWTISGNSIYQTATRTPTTGNPHYGIQVNTSGSNFNITQNYIGGTAPNAAGGAWTMNGSSATRLTGVELGLGLTGTSSVQGNIVTNLNLTTTSNPLTGINITSGNINVGTVTGNTIGSGAGTGSIVGTSSGSGIDGIVSSSSGVINISNNTIGSITTIGSTVNSAVYIKGISVGAGSPITVANNLIGSLTTANSLNASSTGGQSVSGISGSPAFGGSLSITGNTIANLNNSGIATFGGQTVGINASSGMITISGNTVRNLTNASPQTQTDVSAAVVGIAQQISSQPGQIVSQNTVYALNSTAATAAVSVCGIAYFGSTSGVNIVDRNVVYGLTAASTGAAVIIGISNNGAVATFQNNMVRLGTEATGANLSIMGMVESAATTVNYYHNSIYLGGTTTGSGSVATYAFRRATGVGSVNVTDNILVNARTNGTGTGKHYNVFFGTNSFITSNYNVYYRSGSSTPFGLVSSTDYADFNAWKTGTAQDANSIFADPNFVDPTGATPNLHVQNLTPTESAGSYVASVGNDFDGETRLSLNPADIGADAGDFTVINDVQPPIIIYTTPGNTSATSNRAIDATLIDGSGVATGALAPRLYYRKRNCAGASAYVSTQGTLTSGTQQNGAWNFVLDYALLPGGVASSGDIIDYFVAAQDTLGRVGSNPAGASGANVNSLTTFPASPNSYLLTVNFSGTVGVGGAGDAYNSLTGAAPCGLFAALSAGSVSGNLTININGNLTETGVTSLNPFNESPAGSNFSMQINGNGFTQTGSNGSGLINLNGADLVTFNGVNVSNTATGGAAIRFINDASNNVITNSTVAGASGNNSSGVITIGAGTTTGNDNNVIQNSVIRDSSGGMPGILIYQQGTASALNSGTQVLNNQLLNFSLEGIHFDPIGNENTTINGNTLYQSAPRFFMNMTGIYFASQGTNTISQNTIRDLDTGGSATGMVLQDARSTTVSQNRIYGFSSTSGNSSTMTGISFTGLNSVPASVTIINNMVTIIPDFTTNQQIYGISDAGYSGNTFNAYYNSVLIGGTASGTQPTWALMRSFSSQSTHASRNNIAFNNRTGGTGNHFAGGDQSANAGTFVSNYNLFAGRGATAGNFMDYGTSSFGTAVSWATWKGGPPARDANSTGLNASSVNVTDLFVNPAIGVLNIKVGASSACDPLTAAVALVDNKGTPITGMTTEFDGVDVRQASTPDIGADEFSIDRTCGSGASLSAGAFDNVSVGAGGASLTGDATIRGALTLADKINTGANTLTISCNASIAGASSSSYVIGSLRKDFCSPSPFTYPVGTANGYSPVDTNITALGTNPSSLTVKPNQGVAPATPPLNPSNTLQRYWTLTEIGNLTTNLVFKYLDPTDIAGNEANYRLFRITGGAATTFPPPAATVDTGANTATINGVTDFSDWTLGEPLAPTSGTANISGHVLTNNGQPLAGVSLMLLDTVTSATATVTTDANGLYQFVDIATGREFVVTPARNGYGFNPASRAFSHTGVVNNMDFVAAPDGTQTRRVVNDFDGDGKTDLSVFRPSDATWYIMQSSTGAMRAEQWGLGTDRIVPADYDGDGKTDIAVFRPSNGSWYIYQSTTNSLRAVQWGVSDDVVAPADFDGDGKTDVAVWRASTGTWYITESRTSQTRTVNWGAPGDKPVAADYDGDGKADIAVFRPSNAAWYIIKSSDGAYRADNWGVATDRPVAGDYDGDGKSDLAVFRPDSGMWYVKLTTDGSTSAQSHGTAADQLTPGDYDGDGKIDRGIWQGADGTWRILRSLTNAQSSEHWGTNGDLPTPAAYVP